MKVIIIDLCIFAVIISTFHNVYCLSIDSIPNGPLNTAEDITVRVYQHKENLLEELDKSYKRLSHALYIWNFEGLKTCRRSSVDLNYKVEETVASYSWNYRNVVRKSQLSLMWAIEHCKQGTQVESTKVTIFCRNDISNVITDIFRTFYKQVNMYGERVDELTSNLQERAKHCLQS